VTRPPSRAFSPPTSPPAFFGAAERAIDAFERIHHMDVTVHDLVGNLSPFLRPERFHHRSPLCLAVKAEGRLDACIQFDITRLRHDLAGLPEGRIHICHAGLAECAVPVFDAGKLSWILFAGPRLPGAGLRSAERTRLIPFPKSPWGKDAAAPATLDEEEAQLILEHLRQLAARLRCWAAELKPSRRPASPVEFPLSALTSRQVQILRFIEEEYAGPVTISMLAKRLCLSESRTSHVVQSSCNTSFRELLVQKRLRVAMELLRQSSMSVLEVALASGFDDVAHFHRLFRQRVGTTPAQYRVSGQA